jgi:hypothetical protein
MSMRGWTQADVDAYLARQSANAPKNAPTASGTSTLMHIPEKPQTPAHAKPGGNRGKSAQPRRPNKTEERFNQEMLGGRGVYEGLTFRLPGGSRYTPDWIYEANGQLFAVECKGPHRFPSEGRALTAFLEARAAWRSVVFTWFRWTGTEWREQHCEAVGRGENGGEKKIKKRG